MTENHCSSDVRQRVEAVRAGMRQAALDAGRPPGEVRLMAVTKTRTAGEVNEIIAAGVTLLGENRAQELCARYGEYRREGCEIRFIGRLQTNKVRQIIDKVSMIESVDSLRLAREISRQCVSRGLEMDVLLEVNIGMEESKGGFAASEIEQAAREVAALPGLHVKGLMCIPPVAGDPAEARPYFEATRRIFVDIASKNIDNIRMEVLSMGMSGDYAEAIRCGSTEIRVGTALFGPRAGKTK